MINETTVPARAGTKRSPYKNKSVILLKILAAFLPILALGGLGTWLGTDTFLGGAIVTLGYAFSILVATFVLKSRGSSWRDIGLARPQSWPRTVLLGIGALAALFTMTILLQVLVLNLPGVKVPPIDQSRFNPLEGNLAVFLVLVVLAWTTIAFGEEMFYRAFMITEFGDVFPKSRLGTALVLLTSSTIFGLAHSVEGPLGIAQTFFMGLILGLFYLRTGRNLWVTIIAHGLANTIRFYFLFIGAA